MVRSKDVSSSARSFLTDAVKTAQLATLRTKGSSHEIEAVDIAWQLPSITSKPSLWITLPSTLLSSSKIHEFLLSSEPGF